MGELPTTSAQSNRKVCNHEKVLASTNKRRGLDCGSLARASWVFLSGSRRPSGAISFILESNDGSGWNVDTLAATALNKGSRKPATPTLESIYGNRQQVIGRGKKGEVALYAKKIRPGSKAALFAVKLVECAGLDSHGREKCARQVIANFLMASSLHHTNVIRTLDLLVDAAVTFYEVTEYAAGGDIQAVIASHGVLDAATAGCLFKQMVNGVRYLHEMGVAHRDIKPENLLISPPARLMIADFGCAECFRTSWEAEPRMSSSLRGTTPYISPEQFEKDAFDPRAVDIWACGKVYMAMRLGRHLWMKAKEDEDDLYKQFLQDRQSEGGHAPIESLGDSLCVAVVYGMLDPIAERRLSATKVLQSSWMQTTATCVDASDESR
ncbi:Serine/threonine-protein kinase HAL4/SAT4-like protein [Elsinoe fawcettii]|nr:Serine/threonine-protein kinase HAL4/SAT4-like protein [Elsinoe fawcettii]